MDKAGFDPHGHRVPADSALKLLDRVPARDELPLKVCDPPTIQSFQCLNAEYLLGRCTGHVGQSGRSHTLPRNVADSAPQNIVPGKLVNGSLGKVVDFMTVAQARRRNIDIDQELNPLDAESRAQDVSARKAAARVKALVPINEHVFDKNQLWPHVRFENGRELLCAPLEFTSEGFRGNIEAHRLQVPLIVAYALSIHKSQGQTLSRVKVDFARIFEKGQGTVLTEIL